MTLTNIPSNVQDYIVLGYEHEIKVILLVGWFIFSLFYLMYWYKQQKPTKIFLLGTWRAILYVAAWLYSWLFWLIYPIYIHPNVPVDNLLLFLAYSYTSIISIFSVMFIFNFTMWIPRFIVKFGKFDVRTFEDAAIDNYFGNKGIKKWLMDQKK